MSFASNMDTDLALGLVSDPPQTPPGRGFAWGFDFRNFPLGRG